MKKLNILIIPSWYPNKKDPLWGNYFIKQAEALNEFANVSMLYINRIGLKEINNLNKEKKTDGYNDELYNFKFYKKTILNFKSLSIDYSFKKYAKSAYEAYKKLTQFTGKPDIILVESILPGAIAAKYISKKENIPYIIHEHSENIMQNPIYSKYVKDIIPDANNYMAVNNNMVNIVKTFRKDCNLVPNFINTDKFDVKPIKSKSEFILINVSNFYKVKALEVLFKALDIVVNEKNIKNIKLKIVGTGEYKNYYENIANSLNLKSNIEFLGYIDNNKLPILYANSNVLCVSSTVETFCIPIVEALASGIPVITTNCNGPVEIVNKDNGIIVPINDVKAYAKAIIKMKNNYDKYNSKDLKEYVKNKYDKVAVCKKIINICNETIDGVKNET